MSLAILRALNQYDHFGFLETETLTVSPRNPTAANITDVKAIRWPQTKGETPAGGPYSIESEDSQFAIWASTCSSEPKNGWLLTDGDSQQHTIQSVERRPMEPRYIVTVREVGA